jgi:hypothetical protein
MRQEMFGFLADPTVSVLLNKDVGGDVEQQPNSGNGVNNSHVSQQKKSNHRPSASFFAENQRVIPYLRL